jgi:hypothetical protein
MTPFALLLSAIIVVAPGPGGPQPAPGAAHATVPVAATAAPTPTGCTTRAASAAALTQALSSARPSARICLTQNLPDTRLTITTGGGTGQPVTVLGDGHTVVKGITVEASNVVVDGFQVLGAEAPGIELTGNNITARNNTVNHPTGGDYDGLRFFGNNITISHNTIADIAPDGSGAHADCMQTFTNGAPASQHITIDSNRCQNIDNQCLMAEGPGDVGDGGGGDGTSADWTITNNYCQFNASQGVMVEAVQNVAIRNNDFVGHADKAIGLDIGATGASVAANRYDPGITAEVGMSEDSAPGYHGPTPHGGP